MDIIASEGGLLSRPLRGAVSILLSMAERVEMVIDFSQFAEGTELFIENRLPQINGRKPEKKVLPQAAGNQMIKFIVDSVTA